MHLTALHAVHHTLTALRRLRADDQRLVVEVVDGFSLRLNFAKKTGLMQVEPMVARGAVLQRVEEDLAVGSDRERLAVRRYRSGCHPAAESLIWHDAGVALVDGGQHL